MTQQPFLISGQASEPIPAVGRQTRPSRLFRVVVIIWLLGGLGFLAVRFFSGKGTAAQAKAEPATPVLTAISHEDLLHHIETLNNHVVAATAQLHRAEGHINRSIPGVNRNYLFVEKNHLDNALAMTEAARQELETSRQEFELILNSLRKEHQLQ